MQMRVDKLRDALKLTQPVIPKKATIPSLKYMLLRDGKAVATDLEKMVIIDMPEAVEECLVPHHQVLDLLQNVPRYDTLTMKLENHSLDFSWEDGHANFETIDAKDFPPMPELKLRAEKDVDGALLVKTIKEMVVYAARETSRPVLNGVSLYLGEKVSAAAGDGFRMAYQELPMSFPVEEIVILPPDTVDLLDYLWSKVPPVASAASNLVQQIVAKRQIHLSLTGNSVVFQFGKATLIAKPIEGTPPEFQKLIPIPKNKVKVFGPDVMGALKRLAGVAYAGNKIVRMKWQDGKMALSAQASESGMVEASVPAVTDDGPGRIALNIQYLNEYFTGKEDFVTMGISEEGSPALFTYRQFPAVVIMPMFVQW